MGTEFHPGFEVPVETVVWRFMPLNRLLQVLSEGTLYFASARQFTDIWEGAVPPARIARRGTDDFSRLIARRADSAFEQLCRLTKISCWQMADSETPAMWARYARTDDTVGIKSTVHRVMNALGEFRLQPQYACEDIRVGKVEYVDLHDGVLRDRSMLGRFFHKDRSFMYETEFRAVVSLRTAEEFGVEVPEAGVSVPVDVHHLIAGVRVSPLVSDSQMSVLRSRFELLGCDCPVERSQFRRAFS